MLVGTGRKWGWLMCRKSLKLGAVAVAVAVCVTPLMVSLCLCELSEAARDGTPSVVARSGEYAEAHASNHCCSDSPEACSDGMHLTAQDVTQPDALDSAAKVHAAADSLVSDHGSQIAGVRPDCRAYHAGARTRFRAPPAYILHSSFLS